MGVQHHSDELPVVHYSDIRPDLVPVPVGLEAVVGQSSVSAAFVVAAVAVAAASVAWASGLQAHQPHWVPHTDLYRSVEE